MVVLARATGAGLAIFGGLALLWKAIFLLEPCVGRLNGQPDFDRGDLAWCAASASQRMSVPGPPGPWHYLSLAGLAFFFVVSWYGAAAAWRWWCTSGIRRWIAARSRRVIFVLRYALILGLCAVVDWLVPTITPCLSDFFYSPVSGFHCQFSQDRPRLAPFSLVSHGMPLPIAALLIVIVWYAYEERFFSRT